MEVNDEVTGGGLAYALTDKDDDKIRHSIEVGQEFTWQAAANPTTGYKWTVAIDQDENCGPEGAISVIDESYRSNGATDETKRGMKGVGGKTTFTFKINDAAKTGNECSIALDYQQKWNMRQGWEKAPKKWVHLTIV